MTPSAVSKFSLLWSFWNYWMIPYLYLNFIFIFLIVLWQANTLAYFCYYFIFIWKIVILNFSINFYFLAYIFLFSFRKCWFFTFYVKKDSTFPIWSNRGILIHFFWKIIIFISRTSVNILPDKITIFWLLFLCFF